MNLPDLPEGYYYRHVRSRTSSLYDRVWLMQRRRWWFDRKVTYEYADLLSMYPRAKNSFTSFAEVLAKCK